MMFRLTWLAGVCLVVAGYASAQPAPITIAGRIDSSTEHLLIPVTIGGREFWCNPDSGFGGVIVLDRAKAVAAGLQEMPGVATPDGNPPAPGDNSTTADLSVGSAVYPNHSIVLRTLPPEAPEMDCIMGVSILRRFVVELDYMSPGVVLHERAGYRPPAGATAVPLIFGPNPRVPYVDVVMTLPGGATVPYRMVADNGAAFYGAILLGLSVTRVQQALPSAPAIVYSDTRVTELSAARPPALTVGPFAIAQPVVGLLQGSFPGASDGMLGEGFFKRFTTAFDFDGRVMYLTPNARFRDPHPYDASGVGFIRRDGKLVVHTVLAQTAGATAGLLAGDELVEIDGRDTSDLTIVQLRDLLSVDGATRRLVIARSGQRLVVNLRLRSRI